MKVEEFMKKTFNVRKMRFADSTYKDVYEEIMDKEIEGWIDFGTFNPIQNKTYKTFHYTDIYIKNNSRPDDTWYDVFYIDFNKKKGFTVIPKDKNYSTSKAIERHMSPALLKYLTINRLEGKKCIK